MLKNNTLNTKKNNQQSQIGINSNSSIGRNEQPKEKQINTFGDVLETYAHKLRKQSNANLPPLDK